MVKKLGVLIARLELWIDKQGGAGGHRLLHCSREFSLLSSKLASARTRGVVLPRRVEEYGQPSLP